MTVLSTGTAQASPDQSGKTFSAASSALEKSGFTVVVSNTVGDQLPQSDCTVASQQDQPNVPAFGLPQFKPQTKVNTVWVTLNCNSGVASDRNPGNSVTSAAGKAAKKKQAAEVWLSQHPDYCAQQEKAHPEWVAHPEWGVLAGCPGVPTA
jgi:hypothetical protein